MRPFSTKEREICGIITTDGEIVEVTNLADDPMKFEFEEGVLETAIASWHTHIYGDANLSLADYYFFKSWPKLSHFIVHNGEVRCYVVEDQSVYSIDEAEDLPSRLLGEAAP